MEELRNAVIYVFAWSIVVVVMASVFAGWVYGY